MAKFARKLFITTSVLAGVVLGLQAAVATEKKLSPQEVRAAFLRQLDEDLGPDEPPKMPEKFHRLEEGEIPLKADGAVVIDGLTGEALYEKSADQRLFPASTTKIMTALLVIEAGNLTGTVEVTAA
ncbi:MAG: D-alanyl-D-alanine carboxypeptidase, partial [Chthoniobacteraceae bacterium]